MKKHLICLIPTGLFFLVGLQAKEESLNPDDLAFRVGSIAVSKYIYHREYDKAFRDNGTSISEAEKGKWLNEWIERMKIVNRAEEEGYASRPEVRTAVAIMSQYMLVHGRNSPFARKVLDPLIDSGESPEGVQRPRERKLAEIRSQIGQQLRLKVDPAAEKFVLENLELLLKGDKLPELGETANGILFKYWHTHAPAAENYTIDGFFTKYGKKVVTRPISNSAGLRREIDDFLIDEHLLAMALGMELEKDELFVLEGENFAREVVYETYTKRELESPSEDYLRKHFQANQEDFKQIASVAIWVAESEALPPLQELRKKILRAKASNGKREQFVAAFGKEFGKYGFESKVVNWKTENANREFPANLFVAPSGWMPPIDKRNGVYHLIVKGENGIEIIPSFEDMRQAVEEDLLAIKYLKRRNEELRLIEERYELYFAEGFGFAPVDIGK